MKKSFVIDTAVSWRESYSLGKQLHDAEKYHHLSLEPKLLLKINVPTSKPAPDQFAPWNEFHEAELKDFNVTSGLSSDLYFIDQEQIKSKISNFFNSRKFSYISVWGDWEEIINT